MGGVNEVRRVVIGAGHRIDSPDESSPRFPPDAVPVVREGIEAVLEEWRVGTGDLVVTGGANGADLLISEAALERGADVWLMIVHATEEEFVAASVRRPGGGWVERYGAVRDRALLRFQPDELGAPREDENPYVRNNGWMVAAARDAAGGGPLLALMVWDGEPGSVTEDFANRACAAGAVVAVVGVDGQPAEPPC